MRANVAARRSRAFDELRGATLRNIHVRSQPQRKTAGHSNSGPFQRLRDRSRKRELWRTDYEEPHWKIIAGTFDDKRSCHAGDCLAGECRATK
jgi:hypothetical protein